MKNAYKYTVNRPFMIVYYVLIFAGLMLTIGRWYSVINPDFTVINAEIHSHVSNFSLSLITYAGIGYYWLLCGIRFKWIIYLGLVMTAANFVCETLMGFMNTTDIVDAVYGTAGIVIVFAYLFAVKKYGLRPIDPGNDRADSR